jgi:hypothetical protein
LPPTSKHFGGVSRGFADEQRPLTTLSNRFDECSAYALEIDLLRTYATPVKMAATIEDAHPGLSKNFQA